MIYLLDRDPLTAAKMLADEDLLETIRELNVAIEAAHFLLDGKGEHDTLTHWIASDAAAYRWAWEMWAGCLAVYQNRYHAHWRSISVASLYFLPKGIAQTGYSRPPPQNVARKYRGRDPVLAYRNAYFAQAVKPHWSAPDKMPSWFSERIEREIKEYV